MTNDDLRGLTPSEREAVLFLDDLIEPSTFPVGEKEWRTIRAALSRVPVAGEAVDALKFDLDMISAALESPTAATMDRIKRIRTALFAAPPSPPVASDDEREIARDCAASMGYPGPAIATPPADDARDAARMTEAEYKALHFNNPWPAIYATAKRAYEASTANDPTVHCNRFPAWSELSSAAQQKWVDAAMSADQAKGDANV
jgi:hypothetical protein